MFSANVLRTTFLVAIFGRSFANENFEFDFGKSLVSSDFLQKSESNKSELNKDCERDITDWISGLGKGEIWAQQMMDSIPKTMDGIFIGRMHFPGYFDECIQIRHDNFSGKYCSLQILMGGKNASKNSTDWQDPAFSFGLCMPSTCSSQDVNYIVANLNTLKLFEFINMTENDCATSEWRPYRTEDIAAVSFILLLVLIALASTAYDLRNKWQEKENPNRLLSSFSIYSNFIYVFRVSQSAIEMKCLHGIRFLSIVWIILGHSYMTLVLGPLLNFVDVPRYFKMVYLTPVNNAFVAVDTFFFLSGLLACVVFFRDITIKGYFDVPMAFIHRYFRLTPVFAIIMLLQATVITRLGNGPFWNHFMDRTEAQCRKSWWSGLLYVQNYLEPDTMCLGQSWYLSADTQMFWISPIILYPILLWPKFGPAFLLILIFAAASVNFIVAYLNNLEPNLSIALSKNFTEQFKVDYITFHTRMSSWLVGLATGYIICGIKAKKIRIKLSKFQTLIGWTLSLGLIISSLFTIIRFLVFDYTLLESVFYLVFHRIGWTLGLSWIVIACVSGHGGFINTFLSWDGFQPLAKLSYSMFLIHMTIQLYRLFSARVNQYLRHFDVIYSFLGDLVAATVLAVPVMILFEVPFLLIERHVFQNVKILPFPRRCGPNTFNEMGRNEIIVQRSNLEKKGENNEAFKET